MSWDERACVSCGDDLADNQEDWHRLCWSCWREKNSPEPPPPASTRVLAATWKAHHAYMGPPEGARAPSGTVRQRCPVCLEPGLTVKDATFGLRVLCARGCDRDLILEAIEWRGEQR